MKHRFPKMILDGRKHLVDSVITDKPKAELEHGDHVEFLPALKRVYAPKPAIVMYADRDEIHLASPEHYALLCIGRIDSRPEVPTHKVASSEIAHKILERRKRRMRV